MYDFNRVNEEFSSQFIDNGYIIKTVCNYSGLLKIRKEVIKIICDIIKVDYPNDESEFLNSFHNLIDIFKLNEIRLSVFNNLNKTSWFKDIYFSLAEHYIKELVGDELVIQKRVNLSIQLPNDESSLLPVHADVWNGDSPFEIVVWIPLVDCFDTKSMFILPLKEEKYLSSKINTFKSKSSEELFKKIENDLKWVNIKFGDVLLFSQNLMHGNRINLEDETRWSFNCRFKSLFSPYSAKKLGEFFEPLNIKPVTKMGMNYEFPKGFEN